MKKKAPSTSSSDSDDSSSQSGSSDESKLKMKKGKTMPTAVKGKLEGLDGMIKAETIASPLLESKAESKKMQKFTTDLEFYTLETRARVAVQEAIKPIVKDQETDR